MAISVESCIDQSVMRQWISKSRQKHASTAPVTSANVTEKIDNALFESFEPAIFYLI